MKKKVLIYFSEDNLKPTGGPSGYLWNLKQGLKKIESSEVEICFYNNLPVRFESNFKLRDKIPKRILEIRRAINYANFLGKSFLIDSSLNQYDCIHFHWTEEMYLNREFLAEYKGIVILTSHTPCVMFKEKIARLNPRDYRLFKRSIDKLEQIDRYAFERADYIIFPCEQAEEPYYHTWDDYTNLRVASKYYYIPTGIKKCSAKVTREEIRRKYNIPNDSFVISYVGRHNEIKGYNDLKAIGTQVLAMNPNIYFLIAGLEAPLKGLNVDRWIEVGWTNDPHSLIAASDLFLLPNKETFFDLILLEVISLGIPVLMTYTGGNKYFEKFNSEGLEFFLECADAVNKINSRSCWNEEKRRALSRKILNIYREEFSEDVFANNYISFLTKIIGKDSDER